jgi:capsular exopolysaccharide synthesis family protein
MREAELSDFRVIQITSSIAGEAKTTVACQLAKSIARAHRNTVLVDFDLRRPSVHESFAMPLDKGVCELLRGENTVDEVLRPTEQDSLSIVTAGRCDRFALEGLTKRLVDEVISSLRDQFEFVIIDSSPVLPVVDALLIAQRSDATILTALRDVSRGPQLQEAEERLRQVGVNIAGTIVTTKADSWYGPAVDRYVVV